jgi:hypothetical protein
VCNHVRQSRHDSDSQLLALSVEICSVCIASHFGHEIHQSQRTQKGVKRLGQIDVLEFRNRIRIKSIVKFMNNSFKLLLITFTGRFSYEFREAIRSSARYMLELLGQREVSFISPKLPPTGLSHCTHGRLSRLYKRVLMPLFVCISKR